MSAPDFDGFARRLMELVRDPAIRSCDLLLESESKSPIGARWKQVMTSGAGTEVAGTVIPDCVDEVIFQLLDAIDKGVLRLSYSDEKGKVVDLQEEGLGELGGWFLINWRGEYSGQRFNDDFTSPPKQD